MSTEKPRTKQLQKDGILVIIKNEINKVTFTEFDITVSCCFLKTSQNEYL